MGGCSTHVSGDLRIAVAAHSRIGHLRLHCWPAREGGLRLRHNVGARVRRRQTPVLIDGRDSPPGRRGDERRLGPREQPALGSGGNGEHHGAGGCGDGHHPSPLHQAGRPGPGRAVNCPTADQLPARFRRSAAVHPVSKRTTQVVDQLPVDAHLPATVRAGLQVGQVRPRARPQLFAEGKVLEQLALCPLTAHRSIPLHRLARAALRGAASAAP